MHTQLFITVVYVLLFVNLVCSYEAAYPVHHRRNSLKSVYNNDQKKSSGNWTGRWFPDKLYVKTNVKPLYEQHKNSMLVVDTKCDDGKTNSTVDWNLSPINYTCFDPSGFYNPNISIRPVIKHEHIPPAYHAYHACMNLSIQYDKIMTTFGTHRPVWARYGEYKFLPRQRWLHNSEHGAVIMLYHPCAHPSLVSRLRTVVKSCLYRHIITPYNLLPKERPLALITWGHYLQMNFVNSKLAMQFIKDHALHGPEDINTDGLYDLLLETAATTPVVNYNDTNLCANLNEDGETNNTWYDLLS